VGEFINHIPPNGVRSRYMELKSAVQFSKEVEGRLYTFTMAANAPVGEAYDVLFDCLKKVIEISNKNVEKMARDEEEKAEEAAVQDAVQAAN